MLIRTHNPKHTSRKLAALVVMLAVVMLAQLLTAGLARAGSETNFPSPGNGEGPGHNPSLLAVPPTPRPSPPIFGGEGTFYMKHENPPHWFRLGAGAGTQGVSGRSWNELFGRPARFNQSLRFAGYVSPRRDAFMLQVGIKR